MKLFPTVGFAARYVLMSATPKRHFTTMMTATTKSAECVALTSHGHITVVIHGTANWWKRAMNKALQLAFDDPYPICESQYCDRRAYLVGNRFCKRHYERWRRGSNINEKSQYEKTLEERFWEKVDKRSRNECWIWLGSKNNHGYGTIYYGKRMRLAHRYAWEMSNGKVTDPKMCVCHKCDNPICVNTHHLFLGTMRDNSRDMVRKGRNKFVRMTGEKNGSAKLTEGDVLVIRGLAKEGLAKHKIAVFLSIPYPTVKGIVARRCWRHLD